MKKVIKVIASIALCIVVFAAFFGIGYKVYIAKMEKDRYGYLNVKWDKSIGTVLSDLTYDEGPKNNYDLYLPADNSKEAYSLVYYVHGGGFTSGDKEDGKYLGEYLASKGYVVASVNYTLSDGKAEANLNIMYNELVKALDCIIEVSEEKGYNITEMATSGGSAGGCLAMLLAFRYGNESPVPIKFIFQEVGPANFAPELWGAESDEDKVAFVNNMTGKSFAVKDIGSEEYLKAIDEISPSSYVNAGTIPMLMAYGLNDKIVPPNVKIPLLDALEKYNVNYKYIEFPHSGHGLLGDPDKLQEYFEAMDDFVLRYFDNSQ